jgi:hypothetical protein
VLATLRTPTDKIREITCSLESLECSHDEPESDDEQSD